MQKKTDNNINVETHHRFHKQKKRGNKNSIKKLFLSCNIFRKRQWPHNRIVFKEIGFLGQIAMTAMNFGWIKRTEMSRTYVDFIQLVKQKSIWRLLRKPSWNSHVTWERQSMNQTPVDITLHHRSHRRRCRGKRKSLQNTYMLAPYINTWSCFVSPEKRNK